MVRNSETEPVWSKYITEDNLPTEDLKYLCSIIGLEATKKLMFNSAGEKFSIHAHCNQQYKKQYIIENYLIEHLNKYIFSQFTENVTENTSDSYTKFAAEFLTNSGNIYKYKNTFKEFLHIDKNLERNFSNLVTKSKQYVSQNALFNELREAIESSLEFNRSLSEALNTEPVHGSELQYNNITGMRKEKWSNFCTMLNDVISLCRAYCNSLKQILLIYPVPIWDDS